MIKKITCPLCNSKLYKVLYRSTLKKKDFDPKVIRDNLKNTLDDYTKHGQIVRCLECSLVYTNPMEDTKKLLKGYEDVEDIEYLHTEKFRKILLSEHLNKIIRYIQKGKILDIGSFAGFFLELAKVKGFQVYGIEPSKWAVTISKKRGLPIIGSDIEKTKIQKKTFDCITLFDVIEHLPNPHKIIEIINRALKNDGIVVIATPNIDSFVSKILKEKNPYLIRMHLILFSPKTLKRLLQKHGFEIIHCSNYGRVFPVSYILEKVRRQNIILEIISKIVTIIPFLSDFQIRIDIADSFVMIARKK